MIPQLTEIEARVLGCLVEKSLTTPELYPLTMNSLVNACNQKTSRDPVMTLDEETAGKGLFSLLHQNFAERVTEPGSRVPKFRHKIENLLGGSDPKLVGAVCVLLLRGPQTPGEIKGRTDRLCKFESTAEVEALLQDLASRADGPMVAKLARQPGQKETRYRHLFSGAAPEHAPAAPDAAPAAPAEGDRLAALEKRVAALEALVASLAKPAEWLLRPSSSAKSG
jgi:uncharacterized protein